MAPKRRQAVIWTNAGLCHQRLCHGWVITLPRILYGVHIHPYPDLKFSLFVKETLQGKFVGHEDIIVLNYVICDTPHHYDGEMGIYTWFHHSRIGTFYIIEGLKCAAYNHRYVLEITGYLLQNDWTWICDHPSHKVPWSWCRHDLGIFCIYLPFLGG